MKGDFTRDTFNPRNHFSRVLKQQGRVELDADWNEQAAIVLHYLQAVVMDIIGPQGGPLNYCGFAISSGTGTQRDFNIGQGRYYIDGVLCENDGQIPYTRQGDFPDAPPLENGTYLAYLDVWERHVTCLEEPLIKEVALGGPDGPDTATRARVVCQVKTVRTTYTYCQQAVNQLNSLMRVSRANMRARAREQQNLTDPCVMPPEARYRGLENQLYRVEVHRGGQVGTGLTAATFKWSRENGSVIFPIRDIDVDSAGNRSTVTLSHLGRDMKSSLAVGDWSEIVDDAYVLKNQAMPLLRVFSVDSAEKKVVLEGLPGPQIGVNPDRHPLLRRWDHKVGDPMQGNLELSEGAALIVESTGAADKWLTLEDGVQVQFSPGGTYRTGDYWLIPARTATGDVEWPQDVDPSSNKKVPRAIEPDGVIHHYAPLATLLVTDSGVTVINDCRSRFRPLPFLYGYQYASLGIGASLLIGPE